VSFLKSSLDSPIATWRQMIALGIVIKMMATSWTTVPS
jgi:hypothetical protein